MTSTVVVGLVRIRSEKKEWPPTTGRRFVATGTMRRDFANSVSGRIPSNVRHTL